MNVPDKERIVSALAGAVLVAAGLSRRGLARWLLMSGGAALVRRGWMGQCALYQRLGIDKRHEATG